MAKEEKEKKTTNRRMPEIKFTQTMGMIICGVIIVAAIGAGVYLGLLYMDEQEKQDDLEMEIERAELEWERVKGREEKDLTQILAERRDELEEEESIFPVETNANKVMEILLEAAEESGVNILPLSGINPAKTEMINEKEYYKVDFRLNPRGTFQQVLNFIEKLEDGYIGEERYATIVVTDLTISGKGSSWSASLSGSFYSRVETEETTDAETADSSA
ncbi:MAG: hypothetical protein R6U37_09255 [Dehalococcoidia bacterium]